LKDVPFNKQLETTDDQFLDNITLPAPQQKALSAARAKRDRAGAVRIVAEHFRTRAQPAWFFYMHGSPWHENDAPGSVIEKADGLLANRFSNSWPPHQWVSIAGKNGGFDWEQASSEAGTATSRNTFLTELSTAWALTGKTEYLTRALELLRSFVATFPFELEPLFFEDHDSYFGGRGNNTLAVTYRIFRWTDFLYSGAIHAPGVCSDDDVFWIVKQLWFYTMQFYRLVDDPLRRDNHHLVDHGHAQFMMGMAFPEFKISQELVETSAKVIRHHFGANLLEDGGYGEHSAEYQYHIIYHFLNPLGLAQANGYKLFTAAQIKKLALWVEFNANLSLPDSGIPPFGDSDGRNYKHLFGALAAPVMTPRLAAMARALSIEPGTTTTETAAGVERKMSAWRPGEAPKIGLTNYYLNKGNLKKPDPKHLPKLSSANFPYGGYTVFRSAWSPDADYLAVSHQSKQLNGGHAHFDILSFVLHTKGRLLIGDPASWLYFDPRFFGHGGGKSKPVSPNVQYPRGYSYAADSHNMFIRNYDFMKPLRAFNHYSCFGMWQIPECGLGLFKTGGPIEVLEAWHDQYSPLRHRRFFIHLRNLGFAFVDMMPNLPGRLSPYEYSQFLHFNFEVELSSEQPKPGETVKAWLDDAACYIVPGREAEAHWTLQRDEYLNGVYSLYRKPGGPDPWVGELTRRTRGDVVQTNFIVTGGADGLSAPPEARYLGKQASEWMSWQRDGVSAHALDLGPHGTVLLASCPYGKPLECDELTTDAELAVVLLDAKGKVDAWAVARGSKLGVKGKKLLTGRKVEWKEG
jgi:hypothetical protein